MESTPHWPETAGLTINEVVFVGAGDAVDR